MASAPANYLRIDIASATLAATPTRLITKDCFLDSVFFCNIGASSTTVSVEDVSGHYLIYEMPVDPGVPIKVDIGMPCKGGCNWWAADAATVDAFVVMFA